MPFTTHKGFFFLLKVGIICVNCSRINVSAERISWSLLWKAVVSTELPVAPDVVNMIRGEETKVCLPSKGVRLEPPFFPSSPCCEYCFRRFWALRMVPETESRGGGAVGGTRGGGGAGGGGGRQWHPDSQEIHEEEKRETELGGETQTPAPRQAAEVSIYVCFGAGHSLATQEVQVRDRKLPKVAHTRGGRSRGNRWGQVSIQNSINVTWLQSTQGL